jgi:hypothetical protein
MTLFTIKAWQLAGLICAIRRLILSSNLHFIDTYSVYLFAGIVFLGIIRTPAIMPIRYHDLR